jgi:3-phenylpropionate/trans-cinnamate dioxygenase ferredoxin reductase subunit
VVKPWRAQQRPYRVTEVRPERNGAWTLAIEPAGQPGLERFMPGQFAWLTLHGSPFGLREHPFSIASAPEDLPRIEFGIKELGDFTGSLGKVEVGDVAYLDAPYGVFSINRHPDVAGFAGIVGGIGVTPMMSMLRSMAARGDKRPVWLFYGNKDWDNITYREEIDALRTRLNLKVVHILEEPSEEWQGEKGFVTKEVLERHLPADQRAAMHYFLCGPTPMTSAADEALRSLGVPAQRIQTEVFELV